MKPSDFLNAEQREAIGGPKAPPLTKMMAFDAAMATIDAQAERIASLEAALAALVGSWNTYHEGRIYSNYMAVDGGASGVRQLRQRDDEAYQAFLDAVEAAGSVLADD